MPGKIPLLSDGALTTVSCETLLRSVPERVSRVSSPLSRLPLYVVRDIFSLGRPSQAFCLRDPEQDRFYLLQESWGYDIESFLLATVKSLRNATDGVCGVLAEAAPLCFVWAGNFWHWIFEGLARVAVLESQGFRGAYIVPPSDIATETMDILRIPRRRIILGTQPYFIKKLYVSAHMPPDKFTPGTMEALTALRNFLHPRIPRLPAKKRCYIKRIYTRKIQNESEVIAMLDPMGFEVMVPEEQPGIFSQLVYMSNVECSVMPHGANCALAFAQPPGSHFFELFGRGYVNHCNGPMAEVAGLHSHQLVEKSAEPMAFDPNGDYDVDVDFLSSMLRKILEI
ncbi:MAG: glycosyltransferase family 61 protein [Desulfovibrio sp.]|jgi:hypothetical protein|nr:glycosyltransferase family 61 protein [Desulfovibrio sp.]